MASTRASRKSSPVARGGKPPFSSTFGTSRLAAPTAASSAKATKPNPSISPPSSTLNWRRSPPNDQATNIVVPSCEPLPHLSSTITNPQDPWHASSQHDPVEMPSSNYSSPLSSPPPSVTTAHPSGEESVAATTRSGMERGYSLSPMYNLILEYNTERNGNVSTVMEVSWILLHPNLNPSDITCKITDVVDSYTSICVKEEKLTHILRAVNELQTFLQRMAGLINERSQVFCIDPQSTMTTALQGCESRSQLDMAYKILVKRLRIAQQTVMKYEAEYQGTEIPLSPVSTAPKLYSDFDQIEGVDGRMRYMLENIPHHQGHLTPEARRAVQEGVSWEVLHPTQALTWDEPVREQTPIPQQNNSLDPSEAKKKVEWDDQSSPWPDNGLSVEQGHNDPNRLEPSFRFQTSF